MEKIQARPKAYGELRKRLIDYQCTCKELGRVAGIPECTLSHRMTAKQPFTLDEIYDICKALDISPEEIHKYFPDRRTQIVEKAKPIPASEWSEKRGIIV